MFLGAPTEIDDNCGAGAVTLAFTDAVDAMGTCPTVLTITRSWTATDVCGNTSPVQDQTITVQDTTKPVAVCKMDTLYLDINGSVTFDVNGIDGGSSDDCGDVTLTSDFAFASCNDAMLMQDIVLTVTDACGNSDTCMTSILVLDTIPATLTCPPLLEVSCPTDIPAAYTT